MRRFNLVPSGLALVFDLDGVLINSMPLHSKAWLVYLEGLGVACPPEFETHMHGRRNDDIVIGSIGGALTPEQIFEHGAAKERLFRELMARELDVHILPGVRSFLEQNANRPMAVASNAEPANIDFVLDGAGLRHYFPVVIDGFQVARPKPFPDIYLKAFDRLNTAPRNCIVFEDSPTGIQAARAAGARVVGILSHASQLEDVDIQVRDFTDPALGQWLRSQEPA